MKVAIEIKTAELHNRFINVIKFIRLITDLDLKGSKDFIDALRVKHPINGASNVIFSIEANMTLKEIELCIKNDNINAKIIPFATSDLKNFKGCFNMVSVNKVQLYLESGENNKLSMIVDICRMQEMVKMFVDNCNNGD